MLCRVAHRDDVPYLRSDVYPPPLHETYVFIAALRRPLPPMRCSPPLNFREDVPLSVHASYVPSISVRIYLARVSVYDSARPRLNHTTAVVPHFTSIPIISQEFSKNFPRQSGLCGIRFFFRAVYFHPDVNSSSRRFELTHCPLRYMPVRGVHLFSRFRANACSTRFIAAACFRHWVTY